MTTTPAPVPKTPRLERWGARMLVRGARAGAGAGAGAAAGAGLHNPIHVLDADEQAKLRTIERGAVLRSGVAGALSALASGLAAIWAGDRYDIGDGSRLTDIAAFWGVQAGVTIVATLIEIGYLYWDALVSVRALAEAAGLELASHPHGPGESSEIASALARAALELPDSDEPVHGVNPRRESTPLLLVVASLVYKLKIGISSFVLKVIVRRALGRFATRQLLSFAAVPINALWNAVVTFLVLRDARIRTMGPSAIEAILPTVLSAEAPLSEAGRRAVARAVGAAIVRSEHAHPNLVLLLRRVLETLGAFAEPVVLDDTALFLAELAELPNEERRVVLRVVGAAAVLDGRLAPSEKRLMCSVNATLDGQVPADDQRLIAELESLRKSFVAGEPIGLAAFPTSPAR